MQAQAHLAAGLAPLPSGLYYPSTPRRTLLDAIKAKGLKDPKPRSVKYYNSQQTRKPDRPKIFNIASAKSISAWALRHDTELQMNLAMLKVAVETNDTARYVAAWCQLNHLRHEVTLP